jgi:hypothetical protein
MNNITLKDIEPYIGKVVTITDNSGYKYLKERVIAIEGNSVVTEYHHWWKTPEDGLLREHWIQVKNIKSITTK